MKEKKISRRKFSGTLGKSLGGLLFLSTLPVSCHAETNEIAKKKRNKKLGVALVGLGLYSTYELAPALLETEDAYLAGIVTGTPAKEAEWAKKYNIPSKNIYNYDNFDEIAKNDEIDIVYVVLPNAMHADFSIRATKAGKHVICEKPMATSVKECQNIINACQQANVKLSIGYRLQSDPYTNYIKQLVKDKTFGKPRFISTEAAYLSEGNWDQWRFVKSLSGGGSLMNMGVYAIQGLIYGAGMNPISVKAQEISTRPDLFNDTDETIMAQFEFPNNTIGHLFTSHSSRADRLYASCEKGWFELDKAYTYGPLHGRTSKGDEITFPHKRQQIQQIDDFTSHILKGTPNKASGEMGLRDLTIVEAIYKSIANGGDRIEIQLS